MQDLVSIGICACKSYEVRIILATTTAMILLFRGVVGYDVIVTALTAKHRVSRAARAGQ